MPKAQAKQSPDSPGSFQPTPERASRDEWIEAPAPRITEQDWRERTGKVRKTACRITRMRRDGWFDDDGFRSLIAYQGLIEAAGYDRGRSCLDFSPRSNGAGLPPAVTRARDALASIDFALSMEIGKGGVEFIRAVLGPYGMETVGDVAERMRPGQSTRASMAWAREVFGAAAIELTAMKAA
jgi:hypothetical protein